MENKGKSIVVNTSPWIALSICGQIPLLKRIYMGMLSSLQPLIKQIIDNGIWIKDDLVQGILIEAGEK
ncbi:hypothetical protein JXL19_08520 [bacterium]|nr:hypothetical protein [bacterium]